MGAPRLKPLDHCPMLWATQTRSAASFSARAMNGRTGSTTQGNLAHHGDGFGRVTLSRIHEMGLCLRPRRSGGCRKSSARFDDIDFRAASLDGYDVDWPLTYEEIAPYYSRAGRS